MLQEDKRWIKSWLGLALLALAPMLILLTPVGRGADAPRLAAVLAFVGVLTTAVLSLAGSVVTRQANARLAQEHDAEDKRLRQEYEAEDKRLKLDAAMRAGVLFSSTDETPAEPAVVASALLALTELDRADLAVALLVDLWDPAESRVSSETAILVIDAALKVRGSRCDSNAPLVGAELLCRNAHRLDACQSLHWPSSLDGVWNADFSPKTKLLLVDALVRMTLTTAASENALRSIAVRLYGIWLAEERDFDVRGCIGTLLLSINHPLRVLGYREFIQGNQRVKVEDLNAASASAHENPDGFLARMAKERAESLSSWASQCRNLRLDPGSLAHSCLGVAPPKWGSG